MKGDGDKGPSLLQLSLAGCLMLRTSAAASPERTSWSCSSAGPLIIEIFQSCVNVLYSSNDGVALTCNSVSLYRPSLSLCSTSQLSHLTYQANLLGS